MPNLAQRSSEIEIMDDLQCSGEVVHQTLRELETINAWLGGNYVTLNGIGKLIRNHTSDSISLADLGCGGGDILRLIKKWADKKGVKLQLTGIDANPSIISFARKSTPDHYRIAFEAIDIFSPEFAARKFDVVVGTLFFHHFASEQLSFFFRQLASQARLGFVINDIHRHWFAYHSIHWLTQFFSKSSMVKYDAPLSVARAFRKKELTEILEKAGIRNYTLKWMWAFRWQVVVYNQ